MSFVFYCVEDELSKVIVERLLREYCGEDTPFKELRRKTGGVGKMISGKAFENFFQIAGRDPMLVLIDLDDNECPPSLRDHWIKNVWKKDLPEKMFFCIAEVEIESWLLADRKNFSKFAQIQESKIPWDVKNHKKENAMDLLSKSKKADIKRILPKRGGKNGNGNKNGAICNYIFKNFVEENWDSMAASKNSPSLKYLINKIEEIRKIRMKSYDML